MSLPLVKYCPGTLAAGYETYSPSFVRKMYGGKSVSHVLDMNSPSKDENTMEDFLENVKRISLSGFQSKYSVLLEKKKLRLSHEGEPGTYILKPVPSSLKKRSEVPANEHLTMQIARQVYGIPTAENGLVFFKDGEPAYITKRFDVRDSVTGIKWGQEDFASLAGKTTMNSGDKYRYSYEEAAALLRHYVPAWRVEIEKYFSLVVFNFLFSNGDAHLKNFSLLESSKGDYLLSPVYDLINTKLHVDDSDFALDKGLFADGFKSGKYKLNGHPAKADFLEFGRRIGVTENRVEKLLDPFLEKQPFVETLVERSFLTASNKRGYLMMYGRKRNFLLK